VLVCSAASADDTLGIPFVLTKPAGDGPFPAVVILHDCSGLGPRSSGAPWRWSAQLAARGYVTIWPDSFTTRGRPRGVCTVGSGPPIPYRRRAGDAYAALNHLRTLPYVDAKRVAVMGGSHGGSSTLATIVDSAANANQDNRFAAAIALYPACGRSVGGWSVERETGAPTTGRRPSIAGGWSRRPKRPARRSTSWCIPARIIHSIHPRRFVSSPSGAM
jgi:dienelactone hydrolase